jgi:hypothetical protein
MKAIAGRWYRKVGTPAWIESAFMVVAVCWNDNDDGVEVHIRGKRRKEGRIIGRVRVLSPSQWMALSEKYSITPVGWEPLWAKKHWVYTPDDLQRLNAPPKERAPYVPPIDPPTKGFVRLF